MIYFTDHFIENIELSLFNRGSLTFLANLLFSHYSKTFLRNRLLDLVFMVVVATFLLKCHPFV